MKTSLYVLLVFTFGFQIQVYPCTTILVGKNLTADGSIIHAHNEDMGNLTVGRLWYVSSTTTANDSIWVPYLNIPATQSNFAYWASGNAKHNQKADELNVDELPYDNILVGMNDHGVTLSCNWMYSREENEEKKGLRRYAIRQLILERSRSAREAVELIGYLIETYGQADWGGLTYILADPREGWIVETTTHQWVARKLKDNEIIAVANRYTIGEEFDLSSAYLVHHAISEGWYDPAKGPFNFKKIYGSPEFMDQAYDIDRENRVQELLAEISGKIVPLDLMNLLRDRYHGTPEYTEPTDVEPWRETCNALGTKRPICTNLTQSSFIAHLRPGMPVEVGAVMWYTMATPAYGVYFPVYSAGDQIQQKFTVDSAEETNDTAWWVYRHGQQWVEMHESGIINQARNLVANQSKKFLHDSVILENNVLQLLKTGQFTEAKTMLNNFTLRSAESSYGVTNSFVNNYGQ